MEQKIPKVGDPDYYEYYRKLGWDGEGQSIHGLLCEGAERIKYEREAGWKKGRRISYRIPKTPLIAFGIVLGVVVLIFAIGKIMGWF